MKSIFIATLVFIVIALLLFKFLPGGSAASSQALVCHQTSPGVFTQQQNAVPSASDIVPPWKGQAGQNWTPANAALFVYGCKVPPGLTKPSPKPYPAFTQPYPVYTGSTPTPR